MAFHKFKIGQRVTYRLTTTPAVYTVTALLPEKAGEFKYHIRRSGASIDLVIGKSDLREMNERRRLADFTLVHAPTLSRHVCWLSCEAEGGRLAHASLSNHHIGSDDRNDVDRLRKRTLQPVRPDK